MRQRVILPALLLFALLAGCAGEAPPQVQTTPPAEESSAPAAGYTFQVLPVTEEGVRTLYGWEGYEVRKLTPCEGDFLVEYGYGSDPNFSLLDWVFGETGRRVQLTGMERFESYEITGTGQVRYATTGQSAVTPWMGLPQQATARVLGDENSKLVPEWSDVETSYETVWLDPAQPLYLGAFDPVIGPPKVWERYTQVYDARVDADGLSFSFIPNGDSTEKFQSFFPAVTTIPNTHIFLDQETGRFTIWLCNTCLESGGVGAEAEEWIGVGVYPEDLYPYSFPAGSLGRDNHFLKDVTIAQDGEKVVVSALLTDRAWRFTVETSNLGFDNIPSFRIVFREKNPDIDGWD